VFSGCPFSRAGRNTIYSLRLGRNTGKLRPAGELPGVGVVPMHARLSKSFLATMVVALSFFAPTAFAYLDPSTGSMILSAIVGILATLGLALKTYWYKLKSLFRGQKATETETPAADAVAREQADQD
jgi:hypothetical protein